MAAVKAATGGSISLLGVFTRFMGNAVDTAEWEQENSWSSDNLQLKAVL
jgi:hypothetical protein